jgi:putative FmdB family regulatory protein
MPLYEFTCDKCDKGFELLVRSANWEGQATCPHCGSKKLQKKLSVFAASGAPAASTASAGACSVPRKRHGGGCGCC